VNSESWLHLEAEIDGAMSAGDPGRALDAIRAWERHASRLLVDSQPAEIGRQTMRVRAGSGDD
jgi:hypothetical protein